MKKYQFTTPQRTAQLPDGRTRCFYNETVSEETITTKNQETGEETSDTHPLYSYDVVDIDGPVNKGTLVDAMVRQRYSQSEVEAIMRHCFADAQGAQEEFSEFNAYAEHCKEEADRILTADPEE